MRALLFCITLKLNFVVPLIRKSLRALLFCITLKLKVKFVSAVNGLRALLFNAKTADNRLIGGVIEAPKGNFPFGAYSFLYVLFSVILYFCL